MLPRATVVLPTIGLYSVLGRALEGYERQDAPAMAFEVVVAVDRDDPDPGAVEAAVGSRPYPVRIVTADRPGASANRNAGVSAARAPLILFSDNDTIPTRSLVSEHLRWHEREPAPEVAVIGHVRWAPELRVTHFMRWLDRGVQFHYPFIEGNEAGWGRLYTANCSIKAELLERVGGFDEVRLPYGYEDTEWACRAARHGLRVLYNRDAVVDHLRPMTLELWKRRVARLAVSERRFVELHPEVEPYFFNLFSDAVRRPPASGRGVRLAPFVSPRIPVIGARVWTSLDLSYRQALAPHFLEAWEEATSLPGEGASPDLSERDDLPGSQPAGADPSRPK